MAKPVNIKGKINLIIDRLTLRQRITLSAVGVILGLGLLLLLFLNNLSPIFVNNSAGPMDNFVLVDSTNALGTPTQIWMRTPAPDSAQANLDPGFINSNPTVWINILSITGLVLIIFLAILGAHWVANTAIQPISTMSDATRLIQARNLNQRLGYQGPNDEIRVLADSFDEMLFRLNTSFKDQEAFTSNLAHELRTPLSTLHANLEIMVNDPNVNLESYQAFTRDALSSLASVERLVNDLLLLSRGEKELKREPFYAQVLLEEILAELDSVAIERKVQLSISGKNDLLIFGDSALLHQAFLNLIQNAIIYSHIGGFVQILLETDRKCSIVRIKDDGVGISLEDQAHIFDRFFRGNKSQASAPGGTGLGLAIADHIVKLHDGRIEVQSKESEGSVFSLYFPSNNIHTELM